MGNSLCFGCLVIVVAHLLLLAHSADLLFLSIDCGSSSSYNDPVGYTWSGDSPQYVQTGKPGRVRSTNRPVSPQFTTLRYFPTGNKNCYTISGTAQGTKLMVRAGFYYGNYDGLSSPPTAFDLLLDANRWATITFNSSDQIVTEEAIYIAGGDHLSVCVARSQPASVPFISSLEIRSLDPMSYTKLEPTRALLLLSRTSFGSADIVRYPDDPYDRFWSSYTGGPGVISVTSQQTNITNNLFNKPPTKVLLQAITPASNTTTTLVVPTPQLDAGIKYYYFTFYFAEVIPNIVRTFSVYQDGQRAYDGTEPPTWGYADGLYAFNFSLSSTTVISLKNLPGSLMPPLINAEEFFLISDQLTNGTAAVNVKSLNDFRSNYPQLVSWGSDPCLPSEYKWDWLNCSSDPTPLVTELYLSDFGLSGPLADFSDLQSLKIVDLHNNSLNGSIPQFLGQLTDLVELNLAYNQFTGPVPSSLTNNKKLKLNVTGNNVYFQDNDRTNPNKTGIIVGCVIAGALLLLGLASLIYWFVVKRKPPKAPHTPDDPVAPRPPADFQEPDHGTSFTYTEILKITNNLSHQIGEGGSGVVYHGRFQNGQEVAVKVIKDLHARGVKEFEREVKLLLRVYEMSLVKCYGYCNQKNKLILLYEYMKGGNLREVLSGKSKLAAFLSWEKRLQAAMNVTVGLDYLHSRCETRIIHRDVKSANILLDEKLEAKLADFGLCRIVAKDEQSFIETVVAGTPGYMDPQYYIKNELTESSDVYSFGVVLFEIMSGYPAIFALGNQKTTTLVSWAREKIGTGDINAVADPNLRGQYEVNSMWRVADIAMSCTSYVSDQRPTMAGVVTQLKEAIDMATNEQMSQAPTTEYPTRSIVAPSFPLPR